jgi:16S rRNA (adenine1518-N6/adenine1519-N6)-dimethyltransferase
MEGIRPRKRLGQHFLVSRRVSSFFARWACRFRRLLEIGPGTGSLTAQILRTCNVELLVGLEIDTRMLENLSSLSLVAEALQTVHGDALSPPLRLRGFDAVYGSIPYNITGPLIRLIVSEFQKPVLLLIQKEVADRLGARPGAPEYGRLTVLVQLVYDVVKHMVVPPSAFKPRPKVFSQIVELVPKNSIEYRIVSKVEEVTRCFFSQRNKKALKIARQCLGEVPLSIVEKYDLANKRVYELSPDFFIEIAELST